MPLETLPNSQYCDFAESYERSRMPASIALEQKVLGGNYGATSWTTLKQLNHIVHSLKFQTGVDLLEIGAGSGWPGLYLSQITGCNTILVDIPQNALRLTIERATTDRITAKITAVAADGTKLPFAKTSFDRLSHSDVLCCLRDKLSLLLECRRVSRPEARMHFSVISPAADLSASDHQQAVDLGPPFVDVPNSYELLLKKANWHIESLIDVSREFQQSLRAFIGGMKNNSSAFEEIFGPEEFAKQCQRRQKQLTAVKRGLLRREVFVAVAY